MSKRNTKDHPLTKGGALIQAREMLGPSARVGKRFNILMDDESETETIAGGESWETALEAAHTTDDVKAWQQYKADQANELHAARYSLLAKTKEFFKDTKLMKLLSRSEVKFLKGSLRAR